jgi:MFS transporter, SP family, general alpha glucoside:H+ symporter
LPDQTGALKPETEFPATTLHSKEQAPTAIDAIQKTIEAEMLASAHETSSYIECFRGSNWRRTRIIAYANTLQQFLGVTLLSHSAYFLELGGLDPSKTLTVLQWASALVFWPMLFHGFR